MAIPKVFSLYKTGSFGESFPNIGILGPKVDFFLQCVCYDALIPVSVKADKRLDIFEEAVLQLIAYKAADRSEIADMLCLSKDLVSIIIIRLQEMGLAENNGYSVSQEGKKYLKADAEIESSVEFIQGKLFVLKKTGEILPYIHTGEFETEYVETYTPDDMTIECGSAGRPVKIKGWRLRHERTADKGNQDNMLKPDRIRNALRRFNRIADHNPRFDQILFNENYMIENTRSEDIHFHMQAVVQEGNIDEILVSDGFVPHVEFVGQYIKQVYPKFITHVKEKAVLKRLGDEGGSREESGNKKDDFQPEKYHEIRSIWENICEGYKDLEERYARCENEPAPNISQDRYKNDKAIQKRLITDCYSALEWCFYYYCVANPPSAQIRNVLISQTSMHNAQIVEEFARKAGIRNPQEYSPLFKGMDGGKIERLYKSQEDKIPNMNLCLPLALIDAAENYAGRMRKLLVERPGLFHQILKLRNLRNDLQHQTKAEDINFDYVRELIDLVKGSMAVILSEAISENSTGQNPSGRTADNNSRDRLHAEVSLERALGNIYFNNILPEDLRNEWILVSPDKSADRLPDPAGYIDILSRILQETLLISIREYHKDISLSKEIIVREVEKRTGKKLPKALTAVGENYIECILKNQNSTLGAHALVYLYVIKPEKAKELVEAGYLDIVEKMLDHRKHGNNVSLRVDTQELNALRDDMIGLCKKIGGEV